MACFKIAYPTKAAARAAIRGRRTWTAHRAYWCPECGLWHLTSRTRAQERDYRRYRREG